MNIPFTKAHGAHNDFLLTPVSEAPSTNLAGTARAICDRHTGAGADGWILIDAAPPRIRLFNADGSEAEISGNGTRCAAAWLIERGAAAGELSILTGAGEKHLRMVERDGLRFVFEMKMGRAVCAPGDLHYALPLAAGPREVTILDVGNPQCAVLVENFDFDWESLGAEIESHVHFARRTNVSFVRVVDRHTVDVRFFERGVGVTMSSGTGSTGAAAAAVLRGAAESPVRVLTPAGGLDLRWDKDAIYLLGPAEIVARGEFYLG
jgi:diaminopimelate epimerase